jgi:hypothetical protein
MCSLGAYFAGVFEVQRFEAAPQDVAMTAYETAA